MKKDGVFKSLIFTGIVLVLTIMMYRVYLDFEQTEYKSSMNYDNMTLYKLDHYADDGRLIKSYPSVAIISETDDYTTIHDTESGQNIRVMNGTLDFEKIQ